MKNHCQSLAAQAVTVGSITLSFLLLSGAPGIQAATIAGDVTRFSPNTGQPIFPAGNLNVFKQYVVGFDLNKRVGKKVSIDLLFDTLEFGGEVSGSVHANFGIEVGLCFGGNADFDLAFQPTVTLPDQYPFEVALPLTVSEGLVSDSHFTTSFPPLGKAYADLIFDLGAQLKTTACVFGCIDPPQFNFGFETCDIPALPGSGVRLFNPSVRCDPTLTAKKYCSIELASFNRNDDSKLRMINVAATNQYDFIAKPYLQTNLAVNTGITNLTNFLGNRVASSLAGRYGKLSISAPSVSTDSRRSTIDASEKPFVVNQFDVSDNRLEVLGALPGFRNGQKVRVSSSGTLPGGLGSSCLYYVIDSVPGVFLRLATKPGGPPVDITSTGTGTHHIFRTESAGGAAVLKSSGAEDVLGIGIDVAAMAKDIMFPAPPPPAPKPPGLKGSGSVGPIHADYTLASLELGPAVQLQTDFEMTWHLEVTGITFREPGTSNGRAVKINGQTVTNLAQVTPAKTYHLKNRGPNALPLITLLSMDPVEVDISYILKPNLKTVVSTPFIGRMTYEALAAGASIDRVGQLRFGPMLKGEQKFKAGEFTVFNGNPRPIQSGAPRSEYGSTKDRERYDLRLLKNTPINSIPGAGCSVVIVSEFGGVLNIRIFNPGGEKVEDGLATSLLTPSAATALNTKLTPFPVDESGLTSGQKAAILQDATTLAGYAPGHLKFIMQASGPPSFDWRPDQLAQLAGASSGDWTQEYPANSPKVTNWRELLAGATNSYPGKEGPSSYAQVTNGLPHPILKTNITIATLNIGSGRQLTITNSPSVSAPQLAIGGGLVDNSGTIYLSSASSLLLNSTNAVLCGPGTLQLDGALKVGEALAINPVTFVNYNTINGGGSIDSSGPELSLKNIGTIRADGGYMTVYTGPAVNQGSLEARAGGFLEMGSTRYQSRAGSRVVASGGGFVALFAESGEHGGLILATNGGTVNLIPGTTNHAVWNAGQSFTEDVGSFRAEGAGSVLAFNSSDMNGGCFFADSTGSIQAVDTDFTGSKLQIGDLDTNAVNAASGSLELHRSVLTKVSLNNYGTVSVGDQAEFRDNVLFANNGTVQVLAGGTLRILETTNLTTAPGASAEATRQPGTANATAGALLGGTWDIAGTLLLDGASFTSLSANAARASTGSSSAGTNGVIGLDAEDDLSRVLSLGNPANVILRGADWSFPALATLNDNRGTLSLMESATFPGGALGGSTPGAFTNQGVIHLQTGSRLTAGGSFVQTGPQAMTELTGATVASTTGNFQILGGHVTADANSVIFNRSATTIPAGTTVRVESPLIDNGETNLSGEYIQVPVIINLGSGVKIATIAAGADMTIHGGAVQFPALTDNVRANAGTFTVSGDGWDNPGGFRIGQTSFEVFTNTGQMNLLGFRTGLSVGDYIQVGAGSVTRIGAGARLTVFNEFANNGGEIVVEIASRPRDYQYGQISASSADFGNQLVIDFTGKLADPSYFVDIGDTWEIVPRGATAAANITGTNFTWRVNGATPPANFLPPGSHLALVHFEQQIPGPKRGLGLQVVPDAGFTEYSTWAAASGFPSNYLHSPFGDFNGNGIVDGKEYLFGLNAAGTITPAQIRRVIGADGGIYLELSYTRPSGHPSATYTPYYSQDGVEWHPAAMAIAGISPGPGSNQETVTLQSEFSDSGAELFFQIRADFNTDDLDWGLIREKPLNWGSGLDHLDQSLIDDGQYVVSWRVAPGLELYFNVNARAQDSIYGTGIYRDNSSLHHAVVHAGILQDQENGIVKVTFLPHQTCYPRSTTNGTVSACYPPEDLDTGECCTIPDDDLTALSYRIEKDPGPMILDAVFVAPPPVITGILRTSNTMSFQWTGSTTAQYRVQWKASLTSAWNNFPGVITSSTGQFSFRDDGSQTGGLGTARFYRLVQRP